jgi:ADP-ribose pyrophosphatase YjhB (NUDIX family)
MTLKKEIVKNFGERLRIRVNGVLIKEGEILMLKHKMGENSYFWNVPGGGMEYGSNAEENLKREFYEETGLNVKVEKFLCTFEYLNPPLHTIELYFVVSKNGGEMILGKDPELTDQEQLISEIAFLGVEKIAQIKKSEKHQLFWNIKSIKDVVKWKGYFKFENKSIK